MSKLIPLSDLNISNFIQLLQDNDIIVYENIQGSKVFFNYDGKEFSIKNRSMSNEPINKIDMAMQKYYKNAFDYLEGLDERVKKLLPKDWWFCCQYFYDNHPSTVEYDEIPSNGMILTSIIKNTKFVFDYYEIVEYADLLGIDYQPVIFKGKLSSKQLELLNYFLNTSPKDLEYIFGEDNFASFFYKMLNPSSNSSALMTDGKYQDNLEKLIIKLENEDELSLALLNPLYKKYESGKSEYVDSYSILIADFLEFIQILDIEKIPIKSQTSDQMYLDLMSTLFNLYCEKRINKIINFSFTIPPFFYEDKYKINLQLLSNKRTKEFIKKHSKIEYMFKIIINSFRYKKKKPIGVFNDNTLSIFNRCVEQIVGLIDKKLKIQREISLKRNDLLNFGDFYNVKYPKDAAGEVYPDLYKDLSDEDFTSDKKKMDYGKKK